MEFNAKKILKKNRTCIHHVVSVLQSETTIPEQTGGFI